MSKDKNRRNVIVAKSRYAVGYGHPPLGSRFKPGQSGNAKGRPRGSKNLGSIFHRILNEKVSVREGDRVWLISKFEAMMRNLAVQAVKGDQKAIRTVLALAQDAGQLAEQLPHPKMTIEFVRAEE